MIIELSLTYIGISSGGLGEYDAIITQWMFVPVNNQMISKSYLN